VLPEKNHARTAGSPPVCFCNEAGHRWSHVDKCVYLTPEVESELEDLLAPAIKLVYDWRGDNKVQVGNEEVIYRHEKTYVHPPGMRFISDKESDAKVDEKIKKLKDSISMGRFNPEGGASCLRIRIWR